jgi:hypothetical protein
VLAVLSSGCGKRPARNVPVQGKVLVDGQPAKFGSVTFVPDREKGNTLGAEPAGSIGPDGTFVLATGGKEGAPPGHYKVAVRITAPSDPRNPYSVPRSLIADRFAEADKSGLRVEVKENGNYELKVSSR